jgi:hypothetical protein
VEYKYDLNGILFYIPLFNAALIYWWRGVLIVWLVSMAIILQHIVYFSPDNASLTVNIFNLLVPLVVVIIIALKLRLIAQSYMYYNRVSLHGLAGY